VIGAFLVTTGTGMAGTLSLFYLPIMSDYGFTQASLAVYVSIMGLCSIVTHPTIGKLLARFSGKLRLIGILNGVVGFLIYLWLSQCVKLFQFYIGGMFLSILVPVVGGVYGSTVVTHWFAKKRSVAMAVVLIGISAGTVLYSQVCRYVIDNFGWHKGYLCVGIMMLIISTTGALLVSAPPANYGLKPYGWEEQGDKPMMYGRTLKEARKTPCFWFFMGASFFASIYVMGFQQSIVPMFQVDFKFTAALAAVLMSVFSIACAVAKPVMGAFYEKRGVNASVILLGALMCASILILIFTRSLVSGIIAMVLQGCGMLFTTVIMSSYVADAFGNVEYSAILGFLNCATAIGVTIAPLIIGRSYDITGSYHSAYFVFIVFVVLSTVMTLFSSRMMKKEKASAAAKIE